MAMYVDPSTIPAPLTRDEIVAGLRKRALDAGDIAAKGIGSGDYLAGLRADSRLFMAAAKMLAAEAE